MLTSVDTSAAQYTNDFDVMSKLKFLQVLLITLVFCKLKFILVAGFVMSGNIVPSSKELIYYQIS